MKWLKFKHKPSPPTPELLAQRPQFEKWSKESAAAAEQGRDLFDAYRSLYPDEFVGYVERHPPSARAILAAICLAEAADNPDKTIELGREKARKKYGPAKGQVLAQWQANCAAKKPKSKHQFAEHLAKHLRTADDKPIKASTIKRWLPKIK